jgi:GNAT superfamily N-acetyltransferase
VIRLERVIDTLPAGFAIMRDEARENGHRMLDTLAAEWAAGTQQFDRPGEALLAAYADNILAGIGGLTLEPAIPGALRMRRFYVRVAYRRFGIGRELAAALLEDARRGGLTGTANAAVSSEAFWEALGFAPDRRDGFTHILNGRCAP